MGYWRKGCASSPVSRPAYFATLGLAYYLTGRHEEALDALQKALPLTPNWLPTHVYLAVIYSELGREEEARAEVAEILRLSPNFSAGRLEAEASLQRSSGDRARSCRPAQGGAEIRQGEYSLARMCDGP